MPEQLTRRTCLSLFGAAVFSGCISGEEPYPGLYRIRLQNRTGRAIEPEVTVRKDEVAVYEETHILEAPDGSQYRNRIDEDSIEPEDETWLNEDAYYEVTVKVPDIGEETLTTDDFIEMAGDTQDIECFDVIASIDTIIEYFVGVPSGGPDVPDKVCWA